MKGRIAEAARKRLCVVAGGALLPLTLSALADNGDLYVIECESCQSIYDFTLAGLQQAEAWLLPGTYIVTSNTAARSAYVRVTGHPTTWCDFDYYGECYPILQNAHAVPIDGAGVEVTSVATLEAIDAQIFGASRTDQLIVNEPEHYAGTFINMSDEEIGPGISYVLSQRGINVAALPIGTRVIVKFADGTKALFVKVSNSTVMWKWAGFAWNANGQRINRNGSLVNNPNTSGSGGGAATVDGIGFGAGGGGGGTFAFELQGQSTCFTVTTVYVNGAQTLQIFQWHPC